MPKPAVLLLSGGLDSATAGAIARARAFSFMRCRSTMASGIASSWRRPARGRGVGGRAARVVAVDLAQFGGSALTADNRRAQGSHDRAMAAGIPVTYVPARNTVFLSLALAFAETVRAADIFLGVNAVDYSGYPDCRPEYLAAFEQLANLATKAGVEGTLQFRIHAPLDQDDQGRDHSPRHRVGRRLWPDAQLLRSASLRAELAGSAMPACCGPRVLPRPAWSIRCP